MKARSKAAATEVTTRCPDTPTPPRTGVLTTGMEAVSIPLEGGQVERKNNHAGQPGRPTGADYKRGYIYE